MSTQFDLTIPSGPRDFVHERDMIVRTASTMLLRSQELTRHALSCRTGVSVATVAKHFKCRTDLIAAIDLLHPTFRDDEVDVSKLDRLGPSSKKGPTTTSDDTKD